MKSSKFRNWDRSFHLHPDKEELLIVDDAFQQFVAKNKDDEDT